MKDYKAQLVYTIAKLERIVSQHSPAAFASSLSAEDMVLTDLIFNARLPIRIFTLDTGRLHAETLHIIDRIKEKYAEDIQVYRPDNEAVSAFVEQYGLNGIYDSVEIRKECCRIRKVDPLTRALSGSRAWITGQRRAQSATREALAEQEFDSVHGIDKFNPLASWCDDDIWLHIREKAVPYNPLHDHGYPSIGCEPCTRAIQPGEDMRAGRWWWEGGETKECGLHFVDGKLIRANQVNTK